jgi:hypothetical protein
MEILEWLVRVECRTARITEGFVSEIKEANLIKRWSGVYQVDKVYTWEGSIAS